MPLSTILMYRFLRAQFTTSSFSRGETEQVEQTTVPPTLTQSMAARISCFWMWEFLQMSSSSLLALMEWSLLMMPRPVQGASRRTRSKEPGKMLGYFLPSLQVTTVLVMPRRQRLNLRAFRRYSFRSLAKTQPVFFINWAMQVVLPPGAAARSRILSPAWGSSASTGRKEDALCNMQCPAKYSGVAPMGTFDSQILIPTLLHSARGSRLAPLWIRLCASSFLRVLRVLVRMVRGRCVSLDSKNWTNSAGLKKLRKWSMSSKLQPQQRCNRFRSCSMQCFLGLPSPSLPMFMRMLIVSWICRFTTLMSTGSLSCSPWSYRGGASQSTSSLPYSPSPYSASSSSSSAPSSSYQLIYSSYSCPSYSSSYPISSPSISSSPTSTSSGSSSISSCTSSSDSSGVTSFLPFLAFLPSFSFLNLFLILICGCSSSSLSSSCQNPSAAKASSPSAPSVSLTIWKSCLPLGLTAALSAAILAASPVIFLCLGVSLPFPFPLRSCLPISNDC